MKAKLWLVVSTHKECHPPPMLLYINYEFEITFETVLDDAKSKKKKKM